MTPPRKQYSFNYAKNFGPLASGQSITDTIRIEADADFVCFGINLSANFSSGVAFTSRSNIVGTQDTGVVANGVGGTPTANVESVTLANMLKLPREPFRNAGEGSMPGLHLLRVAFQTNDRPWQSAPMRADLITGEPGRPFLLPVPILIPANSSVQISIFNDIPARAAATDAALRGFSVNPTIDVQVLLAGHKQVR